MTTRLAPSQATRNVHLAFRLILLAWLGFVVAFSWVSWQVEKQEESQALTLVADLAGKSIQGYFAHFETDLQFLSNDVLEVDGSINPGRALRLLKRFKEANLDFANANLSDLNGQILVSAVETPGKSLPNVGQQESFLLARESLQKGQRFHIGRPYIGQIIQQWGIPLRYAVYDKRGQWRYILNATIPLAKQQSYWRSLPLAENTVFGILRDDGYLLSRYPVPARTDLETVYGKPRVGGLLDYLDAHHFPENGITIGMTSLTGFSNIFAFRRLSPYPLTFFVAKPIPTLRTIWWQRTQPFYLLVFVFLASGLGVYYWTIRRQTRREMETQQQEEKFRSIFEGSHDAIMLLADDGYFDCNQRTLEIFGLRDKAEFLTRHSYEFSPPVQPDGQDSRTAANDKITRARQHGATRFEWMHQRKSGETFPADVLLSAFTHGGKQVLQATVRDITEQKAAQRQVEFLAYHDALTGLPNRVLARDHFQLARSYADREQTKMALVFLDLDNFKIINDSLGHVVGDALLRAVAERLKLCVRDTDTLSRLGGDEFLIVLGGLDDLDTTAHVAVKILTQLAQNILVEGHELSTSLSMGIAVYPDDGRDYDTLLKKADTAMYQSKEAGRNTYRFYTEQMNVDAMEHLQIRNNLRKALERAEFVLHYQPQLDLNTLKVIGAEALIRWNHPEFGMVLPGRFIPVAEDSGLIVEIGDWVLREACRQAMAWRQEGLPELVIAVNLSAMQFKRGDLEQSIIRALSESGLTPPLLELELTESILIQDTERVLAMVQRLKALGVKLSIDDFGTGYSSLSYLKSFAVDKLKIDQSFVRDMADDPSDATIVRTIIQMAKSLNLKTVAEGVETARHAELLRLQRCDEVQGYHFAKPMPPDAFARYLAASRPA